MALPLPRSLSPSKVGAFKDCALAFRFTAIDRLPELPSPHAAKGTLVHRALERLFWFHEPQDRSIEAARAELEMAWDELHDDPQIVDLELGPEETARFRAEAATLVDRYYTLEDPARVDVLGTEITLEATVGGLRLRGIIDRLDRTPDGELVVVDYKTGRVPHERQEQARLGGVQFYALLCEQVLGRRPALVRLLYLSEPVAIEAVPTSQALRGLQLKTAAVWSAIERACRDDAFRPRPSALCRWCQFQELCPAYGGDPSRAATWQPTRARGPVSA